MYFGLPASMEAMLSENQILGSKGICLLIEQRNMAEFAADNEGILTEKDADDDEIHETIEELASATVEDATRKSAIDLIDGSKPLLVVYCPHCSFPPEYCEYGAQYSATCLPGIRENCPEVLGEAKDTNEVRCRASQSSDTHR